MATDDPVGNQQVGAQSVDAEDRARHAVRWDGQDELANLVERPIRIGGYGHGCSFAHDVQVLTLYQLDRFSKETDVAS